MSDEKPVLGVETGPAPRPSACPAWEDGQHLFEPTAIGSGANEAAPGLFRWVNAKHCVCGLVVPRVDGLKP